MEAALEQSDSALIAHALGTVARVRGMTQIARDTGMAREVLSRALSPEGNPSFGTVLRVMDALESTNKAVVGMHALAAQHHAVITSHKL